ncbi:MAG: hypothetical protein P4K83_07690 [Terracidiphilus sp.]|nr:hypothetical protein [Terracidiphilus sp.]
MYKSAPRSGSGQMGLKVLRLCCALCAALLLFLPRAEAQRSESPALNPHNVPPNAQVTVYQVNWLDALSGQMLIGASPAGTSFGVNSNGLLAVADTANLVLINTQTGVSSSLTWPGANAVAIDLANNIYVSVLYGSVAGIVKLPYTGGTSNNGYAAFSTPTSSIATCTAGGTVLCKLPGVVGDMLPGAMAFDTSGNLFLATSIGNTLTNNSIWKCTTVCLNGTASPVEIYREPVASPAASISSGQMVAGALALDSAGNLFFTDSSIYIDPSTYAIYSVYSNLNELPVSTGAGYGGASTGYAASPTTLYTFTPPAVTAYNGELDGVAILRDTTNGDTVYFTDNQNGVFAFPDTASSIPLSGGQPTALYMVAGQGAKSLGIDAQGKLYMGLYSQTMNTSGANTIAQIALNQVQVPASPPGTAISPSATLNPVRAILNDSECGSSPAPSLIFTANASATATATMTASGSCSTLATGAAQFNIDTSFTPLAVGTDSVTLTGRDQSGQSSAVTVTGIGAGFTLAASPNSIHLLTGAGDSSTTITVTDVGGFSGAVSLSLTGLPADVSASFSPGQTSTTSILSLGAHSTAAASGPTPITITGTSGSLTQTLTIDLTVTLAPAFTLTPASTSLVVAQGGSTTEAVAITPVNGFASNVAFSVSGLPAGVTASFSPNTATASTTLTLTAASTATVGGPVNLAITGVSGSLTQTSYVSLMVTPPPSFTVAPASTALTMSQGSSATDTLTITGLNYFSGNVTFSLSGLPTGVTASFSPNPASTSSTLTLTAAANATIGSPATLTITGVSGSLTQTANVALTVMPPQMFALGPSATSITLNPGNSATDSILITPANGFSANVNLSVSGLPAGVTASFSPNPATTSSTLTLTAVRSAAATGPVTLTVTGISGSLTETTVVSLTIAPPPSFTLTSSASALTLAQGSSTTDAVTITPANGFTSSVAFSVAGLPSGVTASFSANPATSTSTLTLTAASTATLGGPVTVTVTGISGSLNASATIALTVTIPPSFTLSASPASLSVGQGYSSADTIQITGSGGFTSAVRLSVAGLPTGVTASFSPNPAASTSTITLTAASSAPLTGPVTVTVTGVSGSLVRTATFAVTVTGPPSFSLSGAGFTVARGATSGNTATLTATPVNAFSGTVALSCTVTPQSFSNAPTCSLSPASLTMNGTTAQTSTLTIHTTSTSAQNRTRPLFLPSAGGSALALLFLLRAPRRWRNWTAMLGLLAVFIAVGASGCISSSSSISTGGTPTGTYTVTVTGSSGSIWVSNQMQVVVN